ncbi:hypothetical protein T492DRAFT_844513 [Pavlovales sp. CCMP2436]|nr:hypothetical protein T492DRAFT_844513 [Pavlovales sp. CCMP2436]
MAGAGSLDDLDDVQALDETRSLIVRASPSSERPVGGSEWLGGTCCAGARRGGRRALIFAALACSVALWVVTRPPGSEGATLLRQLRAEQAGRRHLEASARALSLLVAEGRHDEAARAVALSHTWRWERLARSPSSTTATGAAAGSYACAGICNGRSCNGLRFELDRSLLGPSSLSALDRYTCHGYYTSWVLQGRRDISPLSRVLRRCLTLLGAFQAGVEFQFEELLVSLADQNLTMRNRVCPDYKRTAREALSIALVSSLSPAPAFNNTFHLRSSPSARSSAGPTQRAADSQAALAALSAESAAGYDAAIACRHESDTVAADTEAAGIGVAGTGGAGGQWLELRAEGPWGDFTASRQWCPPLVRESLAGPSRTLPASLGAPSRTLPDCFDALRPACRKSGPLAVYWYGQSAADTGAGGRAQQTAGGAGSPGKARWQAGDGRSESDSELRALGLYASCPLVMTNKPLALDLVMMTSAEIVFVDSAEEACLFVYSPSAKLEGVKLEGAKVLGRTGTDPTQRNFKAQRRIAFRWERDLAHWSAAGAKGRNHLLILPEHLVHPDYDSQWIIYYYYDNDDNNNNNNNRLRGAQLNYQ